MKISLVTISYNQDRFLEDAIRSVLDQDYHDLEYIVVDPGSQDRSRSIIAAYEDRIDSVVLDADSGPAEGLNNGFARATGQIFGFLNADDILLPGAVSTMAASFRRFRDADVIAAHGWLVDQEGQPIRKKLSHRFNAWRYLYRGAHLLQQSTFFRADAFHKVGGFNEGNRTCWDGELWLDMALAGCRFAVLNKYLSCFRTYPGSITGRMTSSVTARRAYEGDRNRMFRRATGRDPHGWHYRLNCGAAQLLKWGTNPGALPTSLRSLVKASPVQYPIEA
ncbi:MAG: glycosyltransferase [Rhodospirillales bacterium]|nr:glycosyltransferase [Rhodospirillales bacterium]